MRFLTSGCSLGSLIFDILRIANSKPPRDVRDELFDFLPPQFEGKSGFAVTSTRA